MIALVASVGSLNLKIELQCNRLYFSKATSSLYNAGWLQWVLVQHNTTLPTVTGNTHIHTLLPSNTYLFTLFIPFADSTVYSYIALMASSPIVLHESTCISHENKQQLVLSMLSGGAGTVSAKTLSPESD